MAKNKKNIGVQKASDGTHEVLVYGFIDCDMAEGFAREIAAYQDAACINVRINSIGGSVYDGIAMFNTMRNSRCPIDVYIDGIAASMASCLAMAGRKTYISKYGQIMTHKPMGGTMGNADELRRAAAEVDALEPVMIAMYVAKTGMSDADVTAKFLNGQNNFFNADQAVKAKLVDDIYDGPQVELPIGAQLEGIYAAYEAVLDNHFSNNDSHMKQIPMALWLQLCSQAGITDSTDDAVIAASFKKVIEKANKHDVIAAKLQAKETELETFKKEAVTGEVTATLDHALANKKITAQQKAIFAVDYAENPEGLKKVLATMGWSSVVQQLNVKGREEATTPVVAAMVAKGWDALDREGRLGELKTADEAAYNQIYLGKFGYLPNEKPKPKK